jgi:glycosyltransferase involved in cell wall biosynthesis
LGKDDLVLGYIATFVQGKGHLQLIDAFRKIVADIPQARLLLLGSPAGMLDEVRSAAAEFPTGNVVLAGWRDDVPACLSAMDVFIQASLSEAFSRVIVEAMGTGVPVIATRVGGAEEVIEDGVNGILIPPDDSEAIYRETMSLYKDPELRDAIAKRGMISVRERFTADQMVDRFIGLYENWMNE